MKPVDIQEELKTLVSPTRHAHILRVADTARWLAGVHGLDPDQGYLAGLIHDTAKQLTPESATAKGIRFTEEETAIYADFPKVWHALVAPTVCRALFHITDEDVLDAAKWHTTGKPAMTPLSQVVFISDYIEPGRDVSDRELIHNLAINSLDNATFALSCSTLVSLCERGLNIHPESIACYNHYYSVISRTGTEKIASVIFQSRFIKIV